MRKMTLFLVLIFTIVLFSSAQGALFSTPIDNPSFEADDISAAGWSTDITDWYEKQSAFIVYEGAYPQTPYGTNWGCLYSDGGAIYQQVGTWDADTNYSVDLRVASGGGENWDSGNPGQYDSRVNVELWAGGTPASAADGSTPSDIGAVLVASAYDVGINTDGNGSDVTVVLNTGTSATSGDAMWLVFTSTDAESYKLFDNVSISEDLPIIPTPENAAVDVLVDQVMSWTAPSDANFVQIYGYDVYFDPNATLVGVRDASVKVASNQPGLSYTPPANLDFSKTYYWRVDVYVDLDYIPGTDPNLISGPSVWSFDTVGVTSVITSYDNVFTAMSLLPSDLSAVVIDGDNDVSSVTWELLTDDVQYPAGATASVTDTTTDLYAPTATFVTDANGIYIVRLTVTDAESNTTSQVAEVRVEETTCDLAKVDPAGWTANYYDRDENCIVDLSDFAVFALEWLDDTTRTTQGTWTGTVTYIPLVNGLPNGNFETGTADGWDWAVITDVAADVQEGSYASTFDGLGGVTSSALDLPVGNHSITFWYKGDLTEVRFDFSGGSTTAAITNLAESTNAPGDYTVALGTVAVYTQYTVEFTVTTAVTDNFYLWSLDDGLGTAGFADDFQLNLTP